MRKYLKYQEKNIQRNVEKERSILLSGSDNKIEENKLLLEDMYQLLPEMEKRKKRTKKQKIRRILSLMIKNARKIKQDIALRTIRKKLAYYFMGKTSSRYKKDEVILLQMILQNPQEKLLMRHWACESLIKIATKDNYLFLLNLYKNIDNEKDYFIGILAGITLKRHYLITKHTQIQKERFQKLSVKEKIFTLHYIPEAFSSKVLKELLPLSHEPEIQLTLSRALLMKSNSYIIDALDVFKNGLYSQDKNIKKYAIAWIYNEKYSLEAQEFYKRKYLSPLISLLLTEKDSEAVSLIAQQLSNSISFVSPKQKTNIIQALKQRLSQEKKENVRFYILYALIDVGSFLEVLEQIFNSREEYYNRTLTFISFIMSLTHNSKTPLILKAFNILNQYDFLSVKSKKEQRFSYPLFIAIGKLGSDSFSSPFLLKEKFSHRKLQNVLNNAKDISVKKAAANAFMFVEDRKLKYAHYLKGKYEAVKNEALRKSILSSYVTLKVKYSKGGYANLVQWIETLPKDHRKSAATGFYNKFQLIQYIHNYDRNISITETWGRYQKHINFLHSIVMSYWNDKGQVITSIYKGRKINWRRMQNISLQTMQLKETLLSIEKSGKKVSDVLKRRLFLQLNTRNMVQLFEYAVKFAPDNDKYLFEGAFLLRYMGQLKKAAIYLQKAIQINPGNILYTLSLAEVEILRKRFLKAEEILAKGKSITAKYFALKGDLAFAKKEYLKAERFYFRQYLLAAYDPVPLLNITHCLMSRKKRIGKILRCI